MTLFIDTTDDQSIRLSLVDGKKVYNKIWSVERRSSETLFPKLSVLLKSKRVKFTDLEKIVGVLGPGPFSRTRTGIVAANALAYALDIPLVGIKKNQVPKNLLSLKKFKGSKQNLKPFYARPANITKPKRRST
ncbi:MAG: tRNA (adenosine(37)-N6)-threonylcarbamoyltransferase complex dimerization subunit type 1 TsaB [Candidatus Doudnabacteria bacterium]|nr:tRNA (adenosine(37)-N6)-threonylcarbamoyltransferase complex dimerization subunit type 1 TsaB [Candidatus Doudnabacteria bacterium]